MVVFEAHSLKVIRCNSDMPAQLFCCPLWSLGAMKADTPRPKTLVWSRFDHIQIPMMFVLSWERVLPLWNFWMTVRCSSGARTMKEAPSTTGSAKVQASWDRSGHGPFFPCRIETRGLSTQSGRNSQRNSAVWFVRGVDEAAIGPCSRNDRFIRMASLLGRVAIYRLCSSKA